MFLNIIQYFVAWNCSLKLRSTAETLQWVT